jgi:hypothetical protein
VSIEIISGKIICLKNFKVPLRSATQSMTSRRKVGAQEDHFEWKKVGNNKEVLIV